MMLTIVSIDERNRYLFVVATDWGTDTYEREKITNSINGALSSFGVPESHIGVLIFKSHPEGDGELPQVEIRPNGKYLIILRRVTSEGGYTDDPELLKQDAIKQFSTVSGCPSNQLAAVVLDDCYLEVRVNESWMNEPRAYYGVVK